MATHSAKDLFLPPKTAWSERISEAVQRAGFMVKSNRITHDHIPGDAQLVLWNVPAKTIIKNIRWGIIGAFDAGAFTIGTEADEDRYVDATQAMEDTVGWYSMLQDAQPGSGMDYISTSGSAASPSLFFTGTPSAGTLDAYIEYIPYADELGLEPGQ